GVTTRLGEGGLGFAKIARDLTAQRESAEALRDAQAGLERRVRQRTSELEAEKSTVTELLRRLVSAQEDERARIARDLHDSLGQPVTALRLSLARHELRPGSKPPDTGIQQALSLTKTLGRDIDFMAWELRPAALDDLGLTAALPRFVEAWSAHVGIPAECRLNGFDSGHLARDVEVAFYRVAQEALNNVSKHAHATRADVVLSTADSHVVLVVEDDGIGFDPSDPRVHGNGVGLASMRERATLVGATLDVESVPGKGTSVFLRAPMNRTAAAGS